MCEGKRKALGNLGVRYLDSKDAGNERACLHITLYNDKLSAKLTS